MMSRIEFGVTAMIVIVLFFLVFIGVRVSFSVVLYFVIASILLIRVLLFVYELGKRHQLEALTKNGSLIKDHMPRSKAITSFVKKKKSLLSYNSAPARLFDPCNDFND